MNHQYPYNDREPYWKTAQNTGWGSKSSRFTFLKTKRHLLLAAIVLLGLLLAGIAAQAQQKRALLIGIGSYPRSSGWKGLSSLNDINYLYQVLQMKGFSKQHIATLLNEQATYEGITQAVEKLIQSCGTGDVVMLHFSGHGQQITDDDGDETDGYDEAWIPFDAYASFDPVEYRGTQHLRDDMIGTWVNALSSAVGSTGSVLVSIDACHSGTATRSQELAITRGSATPFKIPGAPKQLYRPGGSTASDFLTTSNLEKANVVVFSASSPTQVNYETRDANQQGVGSLSYAFAQALADLPNGATYLDLFYRVKARIQATIPLQLPMMEGNGNQQLFAGQYTAPNQNIYIDRWANDSSFTFKLGSLQQLAPGAEIALLDPQTKKQVATAKAHQVSMVETIAITSVLLDKNIPWEIKVLALPAPPFTLLVDFDKKALPKSWINPLEKAIADFGFASIHPQADCWISFLPDTGLAVITKENQIAYLDGSVKNGKLPPNAIDDLKKALQHIAKSRYMRSLPDGGVLADKVTWQIVTKDGKKAGEHDLQLVKGSLFDLSLTNKSDKPIYFALVNILPDGNIEVLLPDAEGMVEDYSIQPGEAFQVTDNSIPIDSKTGREFLRVMVSHSPFDIRPVFSPQAKRRSAGLSSFEEAMQGIMQQEGNGIRRTRSVSVNEITLLTQSFLIK